MSVTVKGSLLRQYIYDTYQNYADEPYLDFTAVTVDGVEVDINPDRWDMIDPNLMFTIELGYVDIGRGSSVWTMDLVEHLTDWLLENLPNNSTDDIATVHVRINKQYVAALKQWLKINHGEVVHG
jgi:hypothetical protein